MNFPFSDSSNTKKRPAVVIHNDPAYNELILCQITSKPKNDGFEVPIKSIDFIDGHLPLELSYARFTKLFTMSVEMVSVRQGRLISATISTIRGNIIKMMSSKK